MFIRRKILSLIFFTIIAFECYAASFDCNKAASPAEKMICGDSALSALDDELNTAYKSALNAASNKQALKDAQRKWIKDDRNRCKDVQCLADVYTKRISELKAYTPNDKKSLSYNGEILTYSNPSQSGIKYPPYPDVWGLEMPVYGYPPGIRLAAKMPDGDFYFSYIKERKEQQGTAVEKYKYAWILFFSQIKKDIGQDKFSTPILLLKKENIEIHQKDSYSVSFSDRSSIEYLDNNTSAHCPDPYEKYLFKKDKNGNKTTCKMLLYLQNNPVKTEMDNCERNFDYDKDYYYKKVDVMVTEYLIHLNDDTFLVVSHGPESIVIIRFDKDFNTKSDLMGKNIFMIDYKVIKNLFRGIDINDPSRDNALYEYILKTKKEK
jgi:uncharacterized protein YecT (DUF1311 family)